MIAFAHAGDLSAAVTESIRCTLFALMSLLNLRLGDFLTPVAPIQIRKLDPQGDKFVSGVLIAVRNRRRLECDDLKTAVKELSNALLRSSNSEKLRTALELYGSHFEDSIRSQIRSLFRSIAAEKGEESGPLERRALHVYDMRSTLVHDGFIPPDVLSKVENEAQELLEQLLAVQLRTATHPRGAP